MISQDQLLKSPKKSLEMAEKTLLNLYGERYRTYRENYKLAGEYKYEPEFPLYLMLEQSYSCNLKCPSCIHGFSEEKKKFNPDVKIMPRSLFNQIIEEGGKNNCPSISFCVNDEPLIIPDLPERIAYAKKHKFMDLFITTNGTFLTLDLVKELISAGLTRILVSIDAATPETYSKVRPGKGDFDRTVKNLEALVDYKKTMNLALPVIRASFVNSQLNAHERSLFIEKFSPLVDHLEVQGFSVYYDHNTEMIPRNSFPVNDFACNEPWRKLIIRANGEVLPCCTFYGYEIVVGNILQTTLKEIYNGKQLRDIRREFKESTYSSEPCQTCSKSFYSAPIETEL
jgi:radical SAM protein with 4Fe4S-binding SPASM domain